LVVLDHVLLSVGKVKLLGSSFWWHPLWTFQSVILPFLVFHNNLTQMFTYSKR
jgi:hypothetical protein